MVPLPDTVQPILARYRQFRAEIDRQIERLTALYQQHLACRRGCCECCINLTVWPVEFFAILQDLQTAGIRIAPNPNADCVFLNNGLCALYPFRPIICRTHGLPLAYLSEQDDGWQVWFCQKNFVDADDTAFDADSVLNMEQINQHLAELQAAFASTAPAALNPTERIALARLVDWLAG